MGSKTKQTASSAIDGVGKIIENGVQVTKTTDSLDHWDFLDEIEAPTWADLSLCDLTNYEIDDPWFDISHQFHQYSSSQLISTVFHSGKVGSSDSLSIQEPPSVSKSRGKSYKTKEWGQMRCKGTSNKQHPIKTATRKSSGSIGSSNKAKPSTIEKVKEIEDPKACSSCESCLTDTKFSKSSSSSLGRREQELESSSTSTVTTDCSEHQDKKFMAAVSCQISSQSSGLLSSLKIVNLRRSYATRPAARMLANGGGSGGCKSSVGSPLDQGSVGKKLTLGGAQNKLRTLDGVNVMGISQPLRNRSKVLNVMKAPAQNVRSLSNRQGNNTLASKVTAKVQQHTSLGKVLMQHKVNKQCQMIDKEAEKVCVGRRTCFLAGIKETASATVAIHQKAKSSDKAAQSMGHVNRAPKQSVAQMDGSKKLVGQKEKTNGRSRDKEAARKVYFR